MKRSDFQINNSTIRIQSKLGLNSRPKVIFNHSITFIENFSLPLAEAFHTLCISNICFRFV